MNRWDLVLWVVAPYSALLCFVLAHVWRYRHDQSGWTCRSTQMYEQRLLRWGSHLFHWGILAVLVGHVLGLLVPASWARAVGVDEHDWHVFAGWAGLVAGIATLVGMVVLLLRRSLVPRVRVTTSWNHVVTWILLAAVILSGLWPTITVTLVGEGFDYRGSWGLWLRELLVLDPRPELLADSPLAYAVHTILALALLAWWPFSLLVHAWSVPVWRMGRPAVLYRSRSERRGRPG